MLTKKLPMPTWYGFKDPNMVKRYTDFVTAQKLVRRKERPQEIRSRIEWIERDKNNALERVKHYREELTENRKELTKYSSQLVDISDVTQFQDQLAAIEALPYVIGLRANSNGRFVVHTRLFADYDNKRMYFGDFEVVLQIGGGWGSSLYVARTSADTYGWGGSFEVVEQFDDISSGWLWLSSVDASELMREQKLAKLIESAVEQLIKNGTREGYYREPAVARMVEQPPANPTWSGTAPEILSAIARSLDLCVNFKVRANIRDTEERIERLKQGAANLAERIAGYNRNLSQLQAELVALQGETEEEPAPDEAAIREELRYMTSLDGVMGMRFTDEGVPVFHLRTSLLTDGARYDMGDYEITFTANTHQLSLGVVQIRRTRRPRDDANLYFHPMRENDDGWFCFGNRADELNELFKRGEFSIFLHLIINTMNTVNPGNEHYAKRQYPQIALDAVWKSPAPSRRLRRQQRRMGYLAMADMFPPE